MGLCSEASEWEQTTRATNTSGQAVTSTIGSGWRALFWRRRPLWGMYPTRIGIMEQLTQTSFGSSCTWSTTTSISWAHWSPRKQPTTPRGIATLSCLYISWSQYHDTYMAKPTAKHLGQHVRLGWHNAMAWAYFLVDREGFRVGCTQQDSPTSRCTMDIGYTGSRREKAGATGGGTVWQ